MKKSILIFLFLLVYTYAGTQVFFGPENTISKPAVAQPEYFEATDIDSDGDLDALIVSNGTKSVVWYENIDGTRTFDNMKVLAEGVHQPSNAIGVDLDGDGDNDIVCAVWGDDELFWLENLDGQGNFGERKMIDDYANGIWRVRAADVDGDGDQDLVSAEREGDAILWYENLDGQGAFSEKIYIKDDMANARDAYPVDFDNDGDLDLVTVDWFTKILGWHENTDGLGAFSDRIQISDAVDDINIVYCVDFDNDGFMDVLARDRTEVFWIRNIDGGANFSGPNNISQGKTINDYMPADFDGDGDQDLLVVHSQQGNIAWFKNDGQGVFGPMQIVPNNVGGSNNVFAGDLDGDGDQDVIAMSWYAASVFWHENEDGLGNTQIGRIISEPDAPGPVDIEIEDLDDDGVNEIIVASQYSHLIYYYEKGLRDGNYLDIRTLSGFILNPSSIAVADIDGDGKKDIIAGSFQTGEVFWFKNLGNKQFMMPTLIGKIQSSITSVKAEDIDGDGDVDIVGTSLYGNMAGIYVNNGQGNFSSFVMVSDMLGGATAVLLVDFNNDDKPDIVVASRYGDKLSLFLNFGNMNFGPEEVLLNDINGINKIAAGDVNLDGKIDIVCAGIGYLAWIENLNGRSDFLVHEIDTDDYLHTFTSIQLQDADMDGDLDIFAASEDNEFVKWFMNEDNGASFTQQIIIGKNLNEPSDIDFEDVDGDGNVDVIISSLKDNKIGWYRNEAYPIFTDNPEEVTICQSGEVNFSASVDKADSYRWQISEPFHEHFKEMQDDEVFSGVNTPELTINVDGTNLNMSRYRLVSTYLGADFYSEPAMLNVDRLIEADAGNDYEICKSKQTLYANDPNQGDGEWSILNGYADFDDIHDPYPELINIAHGTNVFLWTITNGSCVSEDEVEIIKYDSITVSIPFDTLVVNDGENAIFTIETTGDVLSYQWYSDDGALTEEPGSVEGTQTATLTIINVMEDVHPENVYCYVEGECNWEYSKRIYLDVLSTNTEDFSDGEIRLYPNPVYDMLHVKSNEKIISCAIIAEDGKQIRQIENIDKKQCSIPVEKLPQGFYLLKLEMERGSKVLSFIK